MTSKKHSKNGGDSGTSVYIWEGTTSRVMVANRPYGKFYDFYNVSLEYFGYHHVCTHPLHKFTRGYAVISVVSYSYMTGRIHFGGGGRRKSQKLGCPTTTVFPGQ
jgi:hypothetical protein